MPAGPTCACGAPKIDGRCGANPSCDDFRKPHQRRISTQVAARRRAAEAVAHIGNRSGRRGERG